MNKLTIGALAVVGIIGFYWMTTYNSLVAADEAVSGSYAQVKVVMKRQAELIPNLVATVQGYAGHERGAFKEIAEARSGLNKLAQVDPMQIANNAELQKQVIDAQAQMSSAMVKLTSLREAYPELKANTQFDKLFTELSGSVNRIATERGRSQKLVQAFNARVRKFPTSFIASGSFPPKPYVEYTESETATPTVKF